MARRKNSTALFEVMHNDKRPTPRASSGGGGIAAWWPFAKKSANDPTVHPITSVSTSDDPTASVDASTLSSRASVPATSDHVATSGDEQLSDLKHAASSAALFDFSLDPEHQQINLRMSYTSAAVAGFAVAVALALAFILGRHGARHAIPALAEQTTEELRRGPAHPGVMDVGPDDAAATASGAAQPGGNRIADVAATTRPAAVLAAAVNDPKPPTINVVRDAKRTVDLNYVLIQNYFDDEKAAKEARDVLIKHGIPCTVEHGPEGWAPMKWLSVVGIDGFKKTKRVPEYDKYIADIMKVSKEFAGNSHFKQFEPMPFKWRDTKSQAGQ